MTSSYIVFTVFNLMILLGAITITVPKELRGPVNRLLLLLFFANSLAINFSDRLTNTTSNGDDIAYVQFAENSRTDKSFVLAIQADASAYSRGQQGYPFLLALIARTFDASTVLLKSANALFLCLTVLAIWKTMHTLEGPGFAHRVAIATSVTPPLWYYTTLVLKDTLICTLTAFAIGALCHLMHKPSYKSSVVLVCSFIALIPLRAPTTIIIVASALPLFSKVVTNKGRSLLLPIFAALGVFAALAVLRDFDTLRLFGVNEATRTLSTDSVFAYYRMFRQKNPFFHTVQYLLPEVSAFNPLSWNRTDSYWRETGMLRALSFAPWVLFSPGFLVTGYFGVVSKLLRQKPDARERLKKTYSYANWGPILLLIPLTAAASWLTADTTRYRLPDIPWSVALCCCAPRFLPPKSTALLAVVSSILVLLSLFTFYSIR